MKSKGKTAQDEAAIRVLRMNARIQGLVAGLLAGLGIFVATNWLIIKDGDVVGPHLSLLGQYFIGYRVSFVGSLIGFAYAFVLGYLAGYFLTTLYNLLAGRGERGAERPDQ